MATTTNITTTYAGEKAAGYISAALLEGNTLKNGGITVKPNVKYREVMSTFGLSDDIVKGASQDFSATSTVTLGERYLDPKHLQVNLQFAKETFQNDWQAIQMGMSAHEDVPAEFSDFLIGHVAAKVAGDIENKIWAGTSGSDSFDGLTSICSGSVGSLNADISGSSITAANVIDELGKVADGINSELYGNEELFIYVPQNVARAYVRALGGFGAAGLGANGTNAQGTQWYNNGALTFDGIKLFMANGLPSNVMLATTKSNFAFGTGLLSDHNEVRLIDMAETTGDATFRAIMRFTAGVQVGILGDVTAYGLNSL